MAEKLSSGVKCLICTGGQHIWSVVSTATALKLSLNISNSMFLDIN